MPVSSEAGVMIVPAAVSYARRFRPEKHGRRSASANPAAVSDVYRSVHQLALIILTVRAIKE